MHTNTLTNTHRKGYTEKLVLIKTVVKQGMDHFFLKIFPSWNFVDARLFHKSTQSFGFKVWIQNKYCRPSKWNQLECRFWLVDQFNLLIVMKLAFIVQFSIQIIKKPKSLNAKTDLKENKELVHFSALATKGEKVFDKG